MDKYDEIHLNFNSYGRYDLENADFEIMPELWLKRLKTKTDNKKYNKSICI